MAISLGNFFSSNGRTVAGGVGGSGLDTESLLNALVDAKSIPKVKLEDKIELNDNRLSAYADLRTLVSTFKDASNFLRNPPGVANAADNVFKYRSASLSSNTTVAGSSYLAVTVEPGASVQNYTLTDITSLARAKKQKTGSFAIASTDTSVVTSAATPGYFKAGTMTVNGADITLVAGDSLATVVGKFNEKKATTGIEASIIQVNDSEFSIIFSATATGTDADFDLSDSGTVTADADGVLSMLGRTNLLTNGTFASDITGWTDASIGTGSATWDGAGALQLDGDGAGGNEAFAQQAMTTQIGQQYTVTTTLAGLSSSAFIRIGTDADVTLAGNSDVADYEVMADGTVSFTFTATSTTTYLTVNSDTNTAPFTVDDISVVNVTDTPVTSTQAASDAVFTIDGVNITRQSNSINDVVSGVTFSLFATTPALTEVTVNVAADPNLAKSGIISFINAYNDIRVFAAEQSQVGSDGKFTEESYLAGDPLLRSTLNSLSSELTSIVSGLGSGALTTLAEIGITFADLPESADNPFVRNILTLDEDKLDSVLSSNFEEVEKLFEFSFTSDNSNLVAFSRTNALSVNSFSLNLDPGNSTFEATYDDGSGPTTVDLTATALNGGGYTLTGQSGTALAGLVMVYGVSDAATINVTLSQGIGDRIFNILDNVIKKDTGSLDVQINAIKDNTTRAETEITRIDDQIEKFREQLIKKFSALESVISSVNTLLESLDAQANARNNG